MTTHDVTDLAADELDQLQGGVNAETLLCWLRELLALVTGEPPPQVPSGPCGL